MIKRERYIEQIRPFFNNELVKVLTGIQRAGKSVMLDLIRQELMEEGVSAAQCILFNFESMSNANYKTAESLYKEIATRIGAVDGRAYLFLDEIQEVTSFGPLNMIWVFAFVLYKKLTSTVKHVST